MLHNKNYFFLGFLLFLFSQLSAQSSFKATYVICPGETVFLPAELSFARGATGSCNSSLKDIDIRPTGNAVGSATGYSVGPSATTVYEVISNPTCRNRAPIVLSYQVLVDENCTTYSHPIYDLVAESHPWLIEKTKRTECKQIPKTSIYEQDGQQVIVISHFCDRLTQTDGAYYDASGMLICQPLRNGASCVDEISGRIDRSDLIWTSTCDCPLERTPGCSVFDGTIAIGNKCIAKCIAHLEVVSCVDCSNYTGTVFFRTCDNGQQYYFIETTDGQIFDPYFDSSIIYEPVQGQKVNFDFVDASFLSPCSIAEKAINITCIEIADNPDANGDCSRYNGEILFEKCDDGTDFFFIRTTGGEVLDAYFADGIEFVKYSGQQVQFDYVAADFNSPCSIADQAVIVTCIKEREAEETPSIFTEYDWLSDIVDPNNCNSETVTVYNYGSYDFLFVESRTGGILYFQDGSLYCQDGPSYNCRVGYRLNNPISTWTCGQNSTQEQNEERSQLNFAPIDFQVLPNPTLGTTYIQIPALEKTAQVTVINLFGQIIATQTVPSSPSKQRVEIDLTDAQNGIYYIKLRAMGQQSLQRLIKEDMK